jgi:hypothetical protein
VIALITKEELIEQLALKREGFTLDYKEDLLLGSEPKKAEFIKDVLALANSGSPAYIVTGVENETWKPVGITKNHSQAQLNQILQNRTDPPVKVEYAEMEVNGKTHGVVKISGEDPPYVTMVKDRYGSIQRGTVYVRNFDINEGARRADLDRMYTPEQANLELRYDPVVKKSAGELWEATITFVIENESEAPAIDPYVWIQFHNIDKLVRCYGDRWVDASADNKGIPTINLPLDKPIYPPTRMRYGSVIVMIGKEHTQIQTEIKMMALNMKTKHGIYFVNL